MPQDYYSTLGVSKSASQDEIKAAFRKLAHEHHPDKGGNADKFKEVNAAYQVLGDTDKRKKYDQYGAGFEQAGGFPGGGAGFGGFDFSGGDFGDLGDLFGDLFGGRRGGRPPHGQDIQVDVNLSFRESVFGVEKEITLTKSNDCERCGGDGAEPGTKKKTCPECQGQGFKVGVQRTILGSVQTRIICTACEGSGEVPEKPCTTCQGSGVNRSRKTLRVEIPAGIEDGQRVRVRAEGESIGRRGEPGDLYISVHVANDARFKRHGATLTVSKTIGFTQAALGDEIDVETVDGNVKMKIPAGTQSGDKLKLKGKGVQTDRGRGDQIVEIKVATPKKLDRKQKQLLEELNLRES